MSSCTRAAGPTPAPLRRGSSASRRPGSVARELQFAEATFADCTFADCRLDLTSFRFAQLERVVFRDCQARGGGLPRRNASLARSTSVTWHAASASSGDTDRRRSSHAPRPVLVVVGEAVQDQDRLALRRAVLQADDREPAHGHVRIVRRQLVQQRAASRSRRPDGRARALRARSAPSRARPGSRPASPRRSELELLAEAELRDRAVGLGADAVVGVPRRVLELLVPLLPQRREPALVTRGRELVGLLRGFLRASSDRRGRAGGRARRSARTGGRGGSAASARGCAPTSRPSREQANMAGASCGGTSATSRTTADQNSTFVSSGRSGDFSPQRRERGLLELVGDVVAAASRAPSRCRLSRRARGSSAR